MVAEFRSPVKFEVRADGPPATPLGGLALVLEMLAAAGILRDLPETGRRRCQGWSDGQMVLAVLLLNLANFDRVSDVKRLEDDAGLRALVRQYEPVLFGLERPAIDGRFRGGRRRCFPSARSLRDWLDGFHVAGVHDVARVKGEGVIPEHTPRHELFRVVNRRLLAAGCQVAGEGATALTIDLDATIIASGKRECLATYRAAKGLVLGERGYQPLVAFSPELGMAPWIEQRDGNVTASTDNLRGLMETLEQIPGTVERVAVRADGAGYQGALIRFCNDPGRRPEELRRFGTISLICGAKRSDELMAAAAGLGEDAWRPLPKSGTTADGRPVLEWAELPFVSGMAAGMKRSHVVRYVATRQALPGELGLGEGELPPAAGRPACRIQAYLTNVPAPDATPEERANGLAPMTGARVVALAHDRCGRGEEVHAVLKSDLAAGMMPSGRFGANAAWLWLAALALNVSALLRRAGCGAAWHWVRMKRFRAFWLHLVARVVRHGRRVSVVFGAAGARLREARRRLHLAIPPPAAASG